MSFEPITLTEKVVHWPSLLEKRPKVEIEKKVRGNIVFFYFINDIVTENDLLEVLNLDCKGRGSDRPISHIKITHNSETFEDEVMFIYAPEKVSIGIKVSNEL